MGMARVGQAGPDEAPFRMNSPSGPAGRFGLDHPASKVQEEVDVPQPLLGQRLRALRRSRHFSLADVAAATGISRSFLSLVETGGSDITIGRLLRLVSFYDTSLADLLFADGPPDEMIVRAGERRVIVSRDERLEVQMCCPDNTRTMMPFIGILKPGGASAEHVSHEGEEWTHVSSGELELDLEGHDPITLKVGDSIYFAATLGHAYSNKTDNDVTFISVVTPPSM